MQCGMRGASLRRPTGLRVVHYFLRRLFMQWTTPTACDLRFGFEITMYVSAR
jgi:coenzyme PQQ precursor peptide PqqA